MTQPAEWRDACRSLLDITALLAHIQRSSPTGAPPQPLSISPLESNDSSVHYANQNQRLGIDFRVERLPFEALDVMDPRLVRIAPGASNEKHRHAHESLFVVLAGHGELEVEGCSCALVQGQVAHVPRWLVHQTHNRSDSEVLVLLAITDFGLTSAVLGNYDSRTRLRLGGDQADNAEASATDTANS